MALNIIGLGLNDEKDISLKGLETVKKCDYVYLESYTSRLNVPLGFYEKLYGKEIILAKRQLVEDKAGEILSKAKTKQVAFLVMGDPLSATTHFDLILRARKEGIKVNIIHNASILTAVGITGLQLYKFGKTTSIPLENNNIESPYDVLKENYKLGLHTLFILDLDNEQNKFLSVNDAIRYLLKVEIKKGERIFNDNILCVGCAKIGSLDQIIKFGKAKELLKFNFKDAPHCLIVPGKLHFMEEEALNLWQ